MLRRQLESRMGRRGKQEFVQVLRLMENFRTEVVYEAVRDALRLGTVSFDAVKHACPQQSSAAEPGKAGWLVGRVGNLMLIHESLYKFWDRI